MTVLLIEDNPDFAKLVHHWLIGEKGASEFKLEWRDTLARGLERLSQGGVDVVLLDLGLPDSAGFETLMRLQAQNRNVPVIVMSTSQDASLALQMVQRGAQDYVVKSTCGPEMLARILRYTVVRWAAQTGQTVPVEPRIIGVLGAKGGVGTTTFASILALELCRQSKQKTLLADLDVHGGLVSFLTNLRPNRTLLDALSVLDSLDESCWRGIITEGPEGLDVLHSPALMGRKTLHASPVREMLARVQVMYRWIVLDIGRLSPFSAELLAILHELYLFTSSQLPALYEARRVAAALKEGGHNLETVRVVVTQLNGTPTVDPKYLEKLFGVPVELRLPDSTDELARACAAGKLPDENGPFRTQLSTLARKIAGLRDPEPKKKGARLFSFSSQSAPTH